MQEQNNWTFLYHDKESSHISQHTLENPEIYLFYLQYIKNNTSNQSYKAKDKHQDIMILTIITCRKPKQQNNTTTTTQQQD